MQSRSSLNDMEDRHRHNYHISSRGRAYEAEGDDAKFLLQLRLNHNLRRGLHSQQGIVAIAEYPPYRAFSTSRLYSRRKQLQERIYEDLQRWEICPQCARPIIERICEEVKAVDKPDCLTVMILTLNVDTIWVSEEDHLLHSALRESAEEAEFTIAPASMCAVEVLVKGLATSEDCSSSCTICTESFVEGEEVTRMSCKHLFHYGCLLQWLNNKSSCPNCRAQI